MRMSTFKFITYFLAKRKQEKENFNKIKENC